MAHIELIFIKMRFPMFPVPSFKKIFLSSSRRFSALIALSLLVGCSATADKSSDAGFFQNSIGNSWSKPNVKYANLANGPLSGDLGRSLSSSAKKRAMEAEYNALEGSRTGEAVLWQQSSVENGKVTPFPPYQVGSSKCRRYVHAVSVNGQVEQAAATACRDKDGIWTPLT